ncbi:dipeptide ABC transporter ATP-binding protein [Streptomyces triticirhizae]|uniref:ABC transporter ATP-binding protein n=1 Tax=Streptomyces triticirhizae TaxID=2483353 RepID=A0A3M2MCA9_9ACTN|nr:ABC transporter ATP-binding protein [Streptomyces triticirhizae]RMI46275.1 ABC transporter ATP-binding protein [Streptomyces triticirhizae]
MLDTQPATPESAAPTAEAPDTPVATLRDLRVSLSRDGTSSEVLRGVDLDIRPGEVLGLVGESGSGKSVLALALLGLLPAGSAPRVAGQLRVAGVDMVNGAEEERRLARRESLGVVFQDPMTSLNPTMRVGQQVVEAAGSADEAIRLLRAVGVPEPERRMRAFPHELSGGLRQRVMIAMAIAGGPRLIVADEPTTALDVTVQSQVLGVLRRLSDDLGCGVLMITHDLGVAGQIADRIAVMYRGRLAEVGPTRRVLNEPRHPYTLGLLASRLDFDTDRDSPLRTLVPEPAGGAAVAGCAYHPRCPLAVDRCHAELPGLPELPVRPEHSAACFRAEESRDRLLEIAHREAAAADAAKPTGPAEPAEPVVGDATAVEREDRPARPGVVLATTELECRFTVRDRRGRKAPLAALRGVTLDIEAGESLALVGESGSGKSTLLRVLAGLQKATGGGITGPTGGAVQMVFQDAGASLTPWLTVRELLTERLRRPRLDRAERHRRVVAALDSVGLPEATLDARPAELSGGQRQRVALARATIVPPRVLLCDEPTSALDVSLAAHVLNLIQRLRAELGMTVVFVTHDLSVARIIGDRIAVMYLGRLVEIGSADELVADPRHPYTRALLSAVPGLDVELPTIEGEPASPLAPPSGCAYHPRCPVATEECADTLTGIQLVPIGPRPPGPARTAPPSARRAVACVHRGEI